MQPTTTQTNNNMTNTQLPFGLKQYIISNTQPTPYALMEQRLVKAKNKEQAWSKFATQYFGALKPDPKLWVVTEVKI